MFLFGGYRFFKYSSDSSSDVQSWFHDELKKSGFGLAWAEASLGWVLERWLSSPELQNTVREPGTHCGGAA